LLPRPHAPPNVTWLHTPFGAHPLVLPVSLNSGDRERFTGVFDAGVRKNGTPGTVGIDPSELIQPEEIAEIVRFLVTRKGSGTIDEFYIRRYSGLAFD